jgi:hypothetical protein
LFYISRPVSLADGCDVKMRAHSQRQSMKTTFLSVIAAVAVANAENVGWKKYFVENPEVLL